MPLLNVLAVQRKLGIGRSTVFRLIRDGALPVLRIRRRVLVEPQSLQQLIEQARSDGAPHPHRPYRRGESPKTNADGGTMPVTERAASATDGGTEERASAGT